MNFFQPFPQQVSFSQMQMANGAANQIPFGHLSVQGTNVQCPLQSQKKAIEVIVLDARKQLTDAYVVELVTGTLTSRKRSSSQTSVRFEGLEDQVYGLSLFRQDQSVWDLLEQQPLASDRVTSVYPALWDQREMPPTAVVSEMGYQVKPGQGIDKIAPLVGHLPETIWQHPNNGNLRADRPGRNVLSPGDMLYIPPSTPKWIEAVPGNLYLLIRKGTEARLKIRLSFGMQPMKFERYIMEIPGLPIIDAITNDKGEIDCSVPAATPFVTLTFGPWGVKWKLGLETLAPTWEDRGVQQRLVNLGYPCPRIDGQMDPESIAYLRRFQSISHEEPTGQITASVRTTLLRVHDAP